MRCEQREQNVQKTENRDGCDDAEEQPKTNPHASEKISHAAIRLTRARSATAADAEADSE